MKQYIKLNNVTFEVKKSKGKLYPIEVQLTLPDCYEKSSQTKYYIYNYWLRWYFKTNQDSLELALKHFTINSYNNFMFTLKMDVYKNGNFIGQLFIGKTRQEFWTV